MFARRILTALLLIFGLTACGQATNDRTLPLSSPTSSTTSPNPTGNVSSNLKPGNYEASITFGGRTRAYSYHLPPAIGEQKLLPIVFVFHGGGGNARGIQTLTDFNSLSNQKNFIAVYPDGVEGNWNDGREADNLAAQNDNLDDVGFISALIDQFNRNFKADPKRVYASGMSNGGMFSQRLGCDLANKIAAIAPVAGSMPEPIAPNCKPARAISVMMIMGMDDPLIPWAGGNVARGRRGKVISVADTVKLWVSHNGCNATPAVVSEPDKDSQDGTRVRRETYSQCKANTTVTLYAVEGGGHAWPGSSRNLSEQISGKTSQDINASALIWDFFTRHSLP